MQTPSTSFLQPIPGNEIIEHYIGVLNRHPTLDGIWLNIGAEYGDQRRDDLALRCYETALELNPENTLALYNLGLHFRNRDYDPARSEAYFLRCLETDPEYGEAAIQLGYLFQQQDERKKAISWLEKGCALYPYNCDAATELGRLYAEESDRENTMKWLQQGYAIDPENDYPSMSLGFYCLLYGEPEKALHFAEIAIALGEIAVSSLNKGHVHLIRGEEAEALAAYRASRAAFDSEAAFWEDFASDYELMPLYGISQEYYTSFKEKI